MAKSFAKHKEAIMSEKRILKEHMYSLQTQILKAKKYK